MVTVRTPRLNNLLLITPLLLAAAVFASSNAAAESASARDQLVSLLTQAQEAWRSPCRIAVEVSQRKEDLPGVTDLAGARGKAPSPPVTSTEQYVWVDGDGDDFSYVENDSYDPSKPDKEKPFRRTKRFWNGNEAKCLSFLEDGRTTGLIEPEKTLLQRKPFGPKLDAIVARSYSPYLELLADPETTITEDSVSAEARVYRVERVTPNGTTETVWFRTDGKTALAVRGHLVKPNEMENVFEVLSWEQRNVGGITVAYATRTKTEHVQRESPYLVTEVSLKELETNVSLDSSKYDFVFPAGTEVWDKTANTQYFVNELPRAKNLVYFIGIAVMYLAGWWAIRKMRTQESSSE